MGPKRKAVTTASSFFQKRIATEKTVTKITTKSKSSTTFHEDIDLTPGLNWSINGTLIRAIYKDTPSKEELPEKTVAIAAFDLDSTLVTTKTNSPFARDGSDWKWLHPSVRENVREWFDTTTATTNSFLDSSVEYHVVIISNQGGVVPGNDKKRYVYLKDKIKSIVEDLDIPLRFYAAAKSKDGINNYRKPLTGMWEALKTDLSTKSTSVDLAKSFYVGDAAGRPKDFSDSDLKFAEAIGLKFFTPEEFFKIEG